jgi:hypothetical protein
MQAVNSHSVDTLVECGQPASTSWMSLYTALRRLELAKSDLRWNVYRGLRIRICAYNAAMNTVLPEPDGPRAWTSNVPSPGPGLGSSGTAVFHASSTGGAAGSAATLVGVDIGPGLNDELDDGAKTRPVYVAVPGRTGGTNRCPASWRGSGTGPTSARPPADHCAGWAGWAEARTIRVIRPASAWVRPSSRTDRVPVHRTTRLKVDPVSSWTSSISR